MSDKIIHSILSQCRAEGVELELELLIGFGVAEPSVELEQRVNDNQSAVVEYLVSNLIKNMKEKPNEEKVKSDNVIYLADRKK